MLDYGKYIHTRTVKICNNTKKSRNNGNYNRWKVLQEISKIVWMWQMYEEKFIKNNVPRKWMISYRQYPGSYWRNQIFD